MHVDQSKWDRSHSRWPREVEKFMSIWDRSELYLDHSDWARITVDRPQSYWPEPILRNELAPNDRRSISDVIRMFRLTSRDPSQSTMWTNPLTVFTMNFGSNDKTLVQGCGYCSCLYSNLGSFLLPRRVLEKCPKNKRRLACYLILTLEENVHLRRTMSSLNRSSEEIYFGEIIKVILTFANISKFSLFRSSGKEKHFDRQSFGMINTSMFDWHKSDKTIEPWRMHSARSVEAHSLLLKQFVSAESFS